MRLAARMSRIGESATLAVTRRTQELQAQGIDVVDFGPGEPDFPSLPAATAAASQALAQGLTRYTSASGLPDLRRALTDWYRKRYDAPWSAASECLVTVGGKGALFELALAVLDEGDELLLPTPCWVSFAEQARIAGARVRSVALDPECEFAFRAAPILEAMTKRTRAVIVNSPCNPTGSVIAADELEALAVGCVERDVLLVSDEAYELFVYDGLEHHSIASLARHFPEHVVLIGTFSKGYGMTGWRVGYALGPSELVRAMTRIQGHAVTHPATFAMAGAVAALEHRETSAGQERQREIVREFEGRRDLMVEGLNQIPGVRCARPSGAFYALANIEALCRPAGGPYQGSLDFAQEMLEHARVALVPGVAFDAEGFVRLSYACSRDRIEEGVRRLTTALTQPRVKSGAGP